ncbi:YrzI family small protein [Neobacillus sp. WH10]
MRITLNILFFSITFKKREVSLEEAVNQEMVEKLYDQNKDRQISMHQFM